MIQFCISLFLFLTPILHGSLSYWDEELVRGYVHASELQRRWAWAFLAPHLKTLKGNERILDVGCGDGKITADLSRFVEEGGVIGIDPSLSMLRWAKKQYHVTEYSNLSFFEGDFLAPQVTGEFDWIVSFCALQHCPDQKRALEMAKSLLKPGGKLLVLVPAMQNEAWNESRTIVQRAVPWNKYWEGFPPRRFLTLSKYQEILESIGLEIHDLKQIQTMDPFNEMDEIVEWLMGTFPRVVPPPYTESFYRDWIDTYLKLDPTALSSSGVIYAKLGYICIVAMKGEL